VALYYYSKVHLLIVKFNDKSALWQVRLHTTFFDRATIASETEVNIVRAFGGRFQTGESTENQKYIKLVDMK
jgi:hypothetical protein